MTGTARTGRPPELPLLDRHTPGCGGEVRPSRRSRWRAAVLVGVHVLVLAHVVQWLVTGNTLTPVEPSEAGETLVTGAINAGFVLLLLALLATLLFGRWMCGWACHFVAYQDFCSWLLKKLGLRPRPVRSRLLVLVPFYAAFAMFVEPSLRQLFAGELPAEVSLELLTDDLWARMPGWWIGGATVLVDGFLIVWVLGAKGFCTYACPYGALFALADRRARGRIRETGTCLGCGHCTAVCTSNVRVHEEILRFGMVVDTGCMKCTDCVSVCPENALGFAFGKAVPKERSAKRAYDFSWPEELGLAVVFVLALLALRGLYAAVPFLLALGLAVLTAAAALVLWRLFTRTALTFQQLTLRADGKLRVAGFAASVALPIWLVLVAHSGVVRWNETRADAAMKAASGLASGSAEQHAALERAVTHLERVLDYGLVASAGNHNRTGQALYHLGRVGEAEPHLRRAAELEPENRSARVYLSRALLARGAAEAAVAPLDEVLTLDPRDQPALRALMELLTAHPDSAAGRALAERVTAGL
jgi:polyferredoxin